MGVCFRAGPLMIRRHELAWGVSRWRKRCVRVEAQAPLDIEQDGAYGQSGGANGDGTVFSVSVGLGAFVKTQPHAGNVGAVINILGKNLTGGTSLSFNGTAATFTALRLPSLRPSCQPARPPARSR